MKHSALTCRGLAVAVALGLALSASPAAAPEPDARHVTLGAAVGVSKPFHGDFDFNATSWQADVRFDTSRHLGFNVFLEEWRHTDEEIFTNQTIVGPSGVLGRVHRVTARTDHLTRAVGGNLLAKGAAGRVTLIGGGGVSYLLYSRDFSQTMTGCEPASICGDSTTAFDNSSVAAQVQAGIEAAVAPHVAVMGQFRLLVPVQDPGGGHNTLMAGVRFPF
jgi:Outer membrane protein beta-barrel domain